MSITIKQIADELNVSTATVSRSLRNDPLVHPETRARVNQAAAMRGYQGRSGRGAGRRTGAPRAATDDSLLRRPLIGIVLALSDPDEARQHGVYSRMLHGITAQCDSMSMRNSLFMSAPHSPVSDFGGDESLVRALADCGCGAALVVGAMPENTVRILSETLPVVVLSRRFDRLHVDAALQDNAASVAELVGRLSELGHKRLAFVEEFAGGTMYEERYAGFVMGCERWGAEDYTRLRHASGASLYMVDSKRMRDLVYARGITAFVAANDNVARISIAAIRKLGLDVPRDVSVTGFDNVTPPISSVSSDGIDLCTIDPNFVEIGRCAVRLASHRIACPATPSLRTSVVGRFIEGETIGPVRSNTIEVQYAPECPNK